MIRDDLDDETAIGIEDDIKAQTLFEEELNAAKTLKRDLITEDLLISRRPSQQRTTTSTPTARRRLTGPREWRRRTAGR